LTNDYFSNLAGKLGFPESKGLIAILEHLITPEQAMIASNLPGTPEEVATNTGIDEAKVKQHLEDMFDKGVVFPRGDMEKREKYRFARDIIQFHDATQANGKLNPASERKLFDLWHEFCRQEMYPFMAMFVQNLPQPMNKVIPAYKAIKDLDDVQPWENFREIINAQDKLAVVPCSCRYRTTAVEEHCNYTRETDEWKCLQFGRGAEYAIARGSGREITREEALEIADKIEEQGLVHMGNYDDSMNLNTSCQCCQDCCEIFVSMTQNDVELSKVYAPNRFKAEIDPEECTGCEICIDYCQFNAIDLDDNDIARVDYQNCYGCGICVVKCSTGAASLKPQN